MLRGWRPVKKSQILNYKARDHVRHTFVKNFILESNPLFFLKTFDALKLGRVLRDKSTPLDDVGDVSQVVLDSELLHIAKKLVARNVSKGILNPGRKLVSLLGN